MKYLVPFAATILTLLLQAGVSGRVSSVPSSGRLQPAGLSLSHLQGSRDLARSVPAIPGASPSAESSVSRGEKIYLNSCRICHDSGALGAPRLGNVKDWQGRIAKGRRVLLDNAVKGYGQMPAKGGRPSLTAREVGLAIDYMLRRTPSSP